MKKMVSAWVVVNQGKPVIYTEHHIKPMLIFRTRWEAEASIFEPGEKVIPIELTYQPPERRAARRRS